MILHLYCCVNKCELMRPHWGWKCEPILKLLGRICENENLVMMKHSGKNHGNQPRPLIEDTLWSKTQRRVSKPHWSPQITNGQTAVNLDKAKGQRSVLPSSKLSVVRFLRLILLSKKSANLVGVPVCISQIRKFSWVIRKSQISKFKGSFSYRKNQKIS